MSLQWHCSHWRIDPASVVRPRYVTVRVLRYPDDLGTYDWTFLGSPILLPLVIILLSSCWGVAENMDAEAITRHDDYWLAVGYSVDCDDRNRLSFLDRRNSMIRS